MRRVSFFFIFLILITSVGAQTLVLDSLHWVEKNPADSTGWFINGNVDLKSPEFVQKVLKHHPAFGFSANPNNSIKSGSIYKKAKGKEAFFYFITFLLIVFGALRQLFPKYFSDLFRLFFRTTIKQKQVRDQLLQTPLPSLVLNGFFVVSASLYIALLLQHYSLITEEDFWRTMLYSSLALSAVYLVKYFGIVFSGWLFNVKEAANAYVFIVFVVNKMIGIFLLPFILVLAFSEDNTYTAGLILSWCVLGGLYLYRFMLTWSATRSLLKVNPFHFFLYVLAFEVAPLLLIYKALLYYFR